MAKSAQMPTRLNVEGNNGGSYITIEKLDAETIHLEVGWECVVFIDRRIKTDDLAGFLARNAEEIRRL